MLRQSSSRSHRSKKLRPSRSFQVFLLVAVAIWIAYQLTHSYGKRRAAAVETGSSDADPARRRLGRKGFVHFAGHASIDDIAGVTNWSDVSTDDDPLSKPSDGEGDEEDRVADEDDGVDEADDGLADDEEDDDGMDFPSKSQNGSRAREDEPEAVDGGTQNGSNMSVVPPMNGTGSVEDGAAVLLRNVSGEAADGNGTAPALGGSALKNTSSVDLASLRDGATVGDVANSFAVGAPGAEKKPTNNTQRPEPSDQPERDG